MSACIEVKGLTKSFNGKVVVDTTLQITKPQHYTAKKKEQQKSCSPKMKLTFKFY